MTVVYNQQWCRLHGKPQYSPVESSKGLVVTHSASKLKRPFDALDPQYFWCFDFSSLVWRSLSSLQCSEYTASWLLEPNSVLEGPSNLSVSFLKYLCSSCITNSARKFRTAKSHQIRWRCLQLRGWSGEWPHRWSGQTMAWPTHTWRLRKVEGSLAFCNSWLSRILDNAIHVPVKFEAHVRRISRILCTSRVPQTLVGQERGPQLGLILASSFNETLPHVNTLLFPTAPAPSLAKGFASVIGSSSAWNNDMKKAAVQSPL